MFQSARFKLTAWYLLFIMLISAIFSGVIYLNVSRQIEVFIRFQNERLNNFQNRPPLPPTNRLRNPPPLITTDELISQKKSLATTLILINLGIVVVAGLSGYLLSGRTLAPIRQMVDEQNRFISDASHELRTPIATLKAETEASLMEKTLSSTSIRQLLQSNLEEINRLQTLSNRLLDLTQIDTSKTTFETISLIDILQSAVVQVQVLANQKHQSIKLNLKELLVKGHRDQLIEVLVILLDNAIKYSSPESTITLSIKPISDTKVQISVKDQGLGISSVDLPHVFERFYRADKSRSQTEGFGLGLPIAKEIIQAHQGTLSLESTPQKGTTAIITLPLLKPKLS